MQIPFSVQSEVNGTVYVYHTNFEQFYPRIHRNKTWKEFLPYVEQAIELYVLPHIGVVAYERLCGYTPLLNSLQTACAYYAALYAYAKELDEFSALGATQSSANNAHITSIAIFKSKFWDLCLTADAHMDRLLNKLMELATQTDDSSTSLYAAFRAFRSHDETPFFRTASDVQRYHDINNSLRTYTALLPYLRQAYTLEIAPKVSSEVLSRLQTQPLNESEKSLRELLCAANVKYALAFALDADALLIEKKRLLVVSNPDSLNSTASAEKQRVEANRHLRTAALESAAQYMTLAQNSIKTLFPNAPILRRTGGIVGGRSGVVGIF